MRTLKRGIVPFAVKAINAQARTFEGLAATWDLDLGGDIIHPGAFTKTINMWKSGAFAIPLIDQHRYNSAVHDVLGSVIEMEERTEGLWTKFEVDEAEEGNKLLRHIDKKRINGLSIGYEAIAPERDEVGIRHLREVKLYEISAVIWPMNPAATIDADSIKTLFASLSDEEKQEWRALLTGTSATADETALYPAEKVAALANRLRQLRVSSVLATAGQHGITF
jgi:HK97 family phage prohead protease